LKNFIITFLLIAIFSCERTTNELTLEIVKEKYLLEFPDREDYLDSLCNSAFELAKSRAEQDIYRLYLLGTPNDSSHTPVHLLMNDLNFKMLGEYEKKYSYRYCYNEASMFYFERENGYSAIHYVKTKYDSLNELGLTHKPPTFNGGDAFHTVYKYFYCNMDLQNVRPGRVSVHFDIDSLGKAHVKLHYPIEGYAAHELDSVTLHLFEDMPLWNPGRRENNEPYLGNSYTFPFEYDQKKAEEYCI